MGDHELKALLEAVTKLQPLLADPSHFSQLTLLREQVDRITALAGAQAAPNAQPPGDPQGEGAASLAGVRPSSNHRQTGEPFEGGTPSARVHPPFGSRLKGEKFEAEPPLRGAQPATNARPTEEYRARSTKGHGDHMAPQPAPEVRFTGYCGEPPTSTESPAMPSRLPWEQVERIASLVGQHSISNSRTSWDHIERVSFMAGAQPASSTRVAMDMNAGEKGVTPASDKQTSKTQGVDEDCSEYGPPQDSLKERTYKTGKWTPAETLTLVHLRRGHFIKYPSAPHRRNVKASAAERWAEVEDEMFKRNIMRSKSQCQEKWEQLASDFRKVYDHQRNHVPLGEPGYFQMNSAERKERMLRFPKAQLDEAVYNALCEWYSRSSNATDPGDVPNDTSFDINATTPSGGMRPFLLIQSFRAEMCVVILSFI
ncbi:hypothetical protein M758_2G205000 [Ceratodon purpureus]|nr:hypothetical protein M758_2G205000 [Ceratodon purpureus]